MNKKIPIDLLNLYKKCEYFLKDLFIELLLRIKFILYLLIPAGIIFVVVWIANFIKDL